MKFFIFEQKIYAFVENSIYDLKVHSASKSDNGGPHNNFFTEGGVVTKILCLLNVHFQIHHSATYTRRRRSRKVSIDSRLRRQAFDLFIVNVDTE